MSLSYTITAQEYRLLDLVASKEENPRAPDVYMSLWPSTHDTRIPQMTLAQIDQFQTSRLRTQRSSAIGRYQFIRSTLRTLVQRTGVPRNLLFNNVLQDYLALQLLIGRQLRRWQSGTLTWNADGAQSNDPDKAFMAHLSREWAAMPVPFDLPSISRGRGRGSRSVRRGQSYYAGDGLNAAGLNPDAVYNEIKSLRLRGPGQTFTLDLATGSRSHPITGVTPMAQAQIAAGGGQSPTGGSSRIQRATYTGGPVATGLPTAGNPYEWDTMDLLDNRYDFRTGKKVKDLLYNGVNPVAADAFQPNNGRPPVPDIGDDPGDNLPDIAAAPQLAADPAGNFSDAERLAGLGSSLAPSPSTAGPDDGLRGATPRAPSLRPISEAE